MSRIDATVATQVGDVTRPQQSSRDQSTQVEEARRLDATKPAGETAPPSADAVRAAAARLQQVIEAASGRQLNFSFDQKYEQLVAVIRDGKTGETIKEIPPKDLLKLHAQIDSIVGMVVDKQA